MSKMRQMETAANNLYQSRFIRGFLHLYGGQEAICVGSEAALDYDDASITGYRDHCTHVGRGGTILENVTMAMYGDGAANQGQLFEALNIAALWKLPCLFTCENNRWGMGTPSSRSAKNPAYYTRGDYVPGILVDGMDALAIKQAVKFAKGYAIENGPLVIEMDTYRFWNHSASDPGTYRNREEIAKMRKERDPIRLVRSLILKLELATEEELKALEKEGKQEVAATVEAAKNSPQPETGLLYKHIHSSTPPDFQVYGADRDHETVDV